METTKNVHELMDWLIQYSIHTVEYLAIKRNKVLMYTTIWMNPKNIMLCERTQLQKTIEKSGCLGLRELEERMRNDS